MAVSSAVDDGILQPDVLIVGRRFNVNVSEIVSDTTLRLQDMNSCNDTAAALHTRLAMAAVVFHVSQRD